MPKVLFSPIPVEDMGARFLREAAMKTNDGAGDGTTTSIVLAQSILHETFRNIAAGADLMALRRGIQKGGELVLRELSAAARTNLHPGRDLPGGFDFLPR